MSDLTSRRGLGVLAWRRLDRLAANLEGYREAEMLDLFGERTIFFQEVSPEGRSLAQRFGFETAGSEANLGILGGFKGLAGAMASDVLLLLEDDLPLVEGPDEVRRQLDEATRLLLDGRVQAVRLRSRRAPGEKFDLPGKHLRYHGPGAVPALRRALRPGKARRLAGGSVYVREKADRAHRGLIDRTDEGTYLVSAACLPWSNQSVMVRRDFFLSRIVAQAEANPSRRRVNGFPDIEKEWNAPRWRRSGWTVAVPDGLFTHGDPA